MLLLADGRKMTQSGAIIDLIDEHMPAAGGSLPGNGRRCGMIQPISVEKAKVEAYIDA